MTRAPLRIAAAFALAALAVLAAPGEGRRAAAAAAPPVDPAGSLLVGSERQKGLGRTPVALHLGADGSAAASLVDPQALAGGWTGTWTRTGDSVTVELASGLGTGDPVTVSLALNSRGATGTVTRASSPPLVSKVKVRLQHPPLKPKGWTAVVPRIRHTGGASAGDFRGTLVIRRLPVAGKKPKALRFTMLGLSPAGLPGLPSEVRLLPGEILRLAGGALPALPYGVDARARQVVVAGGKGFDPALVEIAAYEEVLRGSSEPATSGTPVPVFWAEVPAKKEIPLRTAAPLAAPWFRDDGGAGALPRETLLVLRDLAPFTGDPPTPAVRVSVRTPAGVEVASSEVALPRGAAVVLRPRSLLSDPADLPGGEGQVLVAGASGAPLLRGLVASFLSATVTQAGTPVAALASPLAHPEPPGRNARIAAPYVFAPQDGTASARISVMSLDSASRLLSVVVYSLDGTPRYAVGVNADPGATVRVDPQAIGMDLALLPGGEGQVVVGGADGLPADRFLADGEGRVLGAPDTFFPGPVRFETARAAGEAVRVDLLDAIETDGSDPGDRDAWLFLRNGGAAAAGFEVRVVADDGSPLGAQGSLPVTVAAGESLRISMEEVLALLGAPVDPFPASVRAALEVTGTASGPVAAFALQFRRSANALGGYVLPVSIR